MILGDKEEVVFGNGYIEDELFGCRFQISPKSFYQVNPVQTEKLYNAAIKMAQLSSKDRILDAYSGIGTISLIAAGSAASVTGVEINKAAVHNAKENSRLNNAQNVNFICEDAGKFMHQSCKNEKYDVVFIDPPRSGCDKPFINSLIRLNPERIVYISCNPVTQKRDTDILAKAGYQIEDVQPVDMFGMSYHVETVVLLSKGEVDSKKVRVEFSLEDMDMSDFQDSATYAQIKDYVLEHSGLKVSNLYISQIKRKCGIEVGKNYNLPKSEDSRQPQCPPEKEKAIRDAFEYFGLI